MFDDLNTDPPPKGECTEELTGTSLKGLLCR